MKKKLIATLLAVAMVLSLVACSSSDSAETDADAATEEDAAEEDAAAEDDAAAEEDAAAGSVESPVAGKKIAYIMLMSPATIFNMWSESFTETAEAGNDSRHLLLRRQCRGVADPYRDMRSCRL